MISLGQISQALDLAEREQVKVKEEMAMQLCPPATDDAGKKEERK
jgi:hypothetical protein